MEPLDPQDGTCLNFPVGPHRRGQSSGWEGACLTASPGPLTSSLPSHVPLTGPKSTAPACPGVRRERGPARDRHNTSERKHSMRNMHGYFVPAKTVRRPRRPNSQGYRLVAHRVDISMSALAPLLRAKRTPSNSSVQALKSTRLDELKFYKICGEHYCARQGRRILAPHRRVERNASVLRAEVTRLTCSRVD